MDEAALTPDDQLARLASLVETHFDGHIRLAGLHDVPVGERGEAKLFQRIVGVGEELAEKDVLVRVQRVNDE